MTVERWFRKRAGTDGWLGRFQTGMKSGTCVGTRGICHGRPAWGPVTGKAERAETVHRCQGTAGSLVTPALI